MRNQCDGRRRWLSTGETHAQFRAAVKKRPASLCLLCSMWSQPGTEKEAAMLPVIIVAAAAIGAVALLPDERVKKPRAKRVSRAIRRKVFDRDRGQCVYCFASVTFAKVHIDHSISKFNRGTHTMRNLKTACSKCNLKKGKKNAREFRRQLAREARVARGEQFPRKRVKKPSKDLWLALAW